MKLHTVASGNYVTSVHGMLHPDRILKEHDFLYILDGTWEIREDGVIYQLHSDDLLILAAGRHHYGLEMCNPGNRHMYIHVLPTRAEEQYNPSHTTTDDLPGTENELFSYSSLLHCQQAPRVRQYIQDMISVLWSQSIERENRLSLFFSLLLCELSQLEAQKNSRKPSDPMIEEIIRLIHSTPQTFFSASGKILAFHPLMQSCHQMSDLFFCIFPAVWHPGCNPVDIMILPDDLPGFREIDIKIQCQV